MVEPLLIGKGTETVNLQPKMANRHGLIAGATGTGKTVTLQVLAEGFSRMGVPVFMADVKGDLSGIASAGREHPKVRERVEGMSLDDFQFEPTSVCFWDVYGKQGHPVRTTVTDMGPLLLGRLLNLNETQEGVLSLAFRVADENGWLLLDIKDLRAMLQWVAENRDELQIEYGNVSPASVGAIQRRLLTLEDQGGTELFGEPDLNIEDLMQTDDQGRGIVNILAADQLMSSPQLYATLLLWLMSELFEQLPEVGDRDKPRFVMFFDEAHLVFDDAPKVLLEKIEQVVRLIRSKGVGVYFITQNPMDIPDDVLGQLGNRVQHALRAFTPRDQKAVRAAAQTFRPNPELDTEAVITQLGVGEALVSTLDGKGQPSVVQRVLVVPPRSRIGPLAIPERGEIMARSLLSGVYEEAKDRESAYEILKMRAETAAKAAQEAAGEAAKADAATAAARATRQPASRRQGAVEAFAKSALRSIGTQIGRQLVRGVLGTMFGRK